ncbi:hypothetical protein [Streptomyces parvulus]
MTSRSGARGRLWAVGDLHVGYEENRAVVERTRPGSDDDRLLVAGVVAETVAGIRWALSTLAGRFRRVVRIPGDHELWTHPRDPVALRGVARYEHLFETCREPGVTTPEDSWPVWEGEGGPAVWCGTGRTVEWHRRFRVATMVYGHLHIPRTTWHEGVRFGEVPVGCPREWRRRTGPPGRPRRILPPPSPEEASP